MVAATSKSPETKGESDTDPYRTSLHASNNNFQAYSSTQKVSKSSYVKDTGPMEARKGT